MTLGNIFCLIIHVITVGKNAYLKLVTKSSLTTEINLYGIKALILRKIGNIIKHNIRIVGIIEVKILIEVGKHYTSSVRSASHRSLGRSDVTLKLNLTGIFMVLVG